MLKSFKKKVKRILSKPILFLYQILHNKEDARVISQFFFSREITLLLRERIKLIYQKSG
jgi:hypothetical protein